jgi:hypothetical protein
LVLSHCSIHNIAGLIDGSVQMLTNHKVAQRNGKWMIERSGN